MKCTIHEALGKIKLIDKKIDKKIDKSIFIDAKKNNEDRCRYSNMSVASFEKNAKANFDSIEQLMKNKIELKTKIDLSNAVTMIELNKEKVTIVQAIAMKKDIELKRLLLSKLIIEKERVADFVRNQNSIVDAKAEKQMQAFLSAQGGAEQTDEIVDITSKLSENIRKLESYEEIDAISINNVIEKLDKEISDFEHEIDIKLSISNATTEIELDFDI